MKCFQQNLLVVLALGLCALCVWQWYGQTLQRNEIRGLNQSVYEKSVAIRDCTNSLATLNHEIAQMDAQITGLRETGRTNEEFVIVQKREINRLRAVSEGLTNQIAEYKNAVETLETKLKDAYTGIQKQNDSLKELVAQRDEFVKRYNDSVKDRNDVVTKYNELATQVQKLQSGGTKP